VDRLDYSKGIPERLLAIETMLRKHRDLQGRFTFIQISSPSRMAVHAYRDLRGEIERLVGHINGQYGGRGCIPIDYRYESVSHEALAVYYRSADVALVTPLRDGMNLVAKEFVASRVDERGALVLSRFAGAARELEDALLVNPYDVEGMAEQIHRAITMSKEEQRKRMQHLRSVVRRNDVYWWLERFLHDIDMD
jgi:trehalose-6-phosphate synthase